MTKKLKAICFGIAFSASTFVWAAPTNVDDVVSSEYLNELKQNGVVIVVHNGVDEDYKLVPDCAFTDDCKSRKIAKDKKGFAYSLEYLYLLPKAEILESCKSTKTDIKPSDISVVMRTASQLTSAMYYSNTRKKTMPLYKKAYMVDNADSRKKIDDLNSGSAEGKEYFVLQDDASFGETLYKLTIQETDNSVYGYFSNLDTMGMAMFKAIKPGNLGISIVTVDCGDSILLYMCMDSNCKKYPNIENIMTESLKARIESLKDWIVTMF